MGGRCIYARTYHIDKGDMLTRADAVKMKNGPRDSESDGRGVGNEWVGMANQEKLGDVWYSRVTEDDHPQSRWSDRRSIIDCDPPS